MSLSHDLTHELRFELTQMPRYADIGNESYSLRKLIIKAAMVLRELDATEISGQFM